MSIQIVQANTRALHKKFVMFPYHLYRKILKNKYWAPPLIISAMEILDPKKYPFYQHAEMEKFLAFRNDEIVGRIAGIIDSQYHKYREKDVGYVGFFEAINDPEVAGALFEAAREWLSSRGMKKAIGPISPTTNHILGCLQNDFTGVPVIQVPYNPDYYPGLWEANGFSKEKDHLAFVSRKEELALSDKIKRIVKLVRSNKRIQLRPVNMKKYHAEIMLAKELYNKAWINNSDFVPWTDAEFDYMANDIKFVIIPELSFFAYVDGKPAGLSVAFKNFNEIFVKMNGRLLPTGIFKLLFGAKKITSIRLAIMGVIPEYRRMGLDALFVFETYERGTSLGYTSSENSLVLEDNYELVNMLNNWGSKPYRTYRVYCRDL
ncbi:MAG: hypothetical protein EHM28_09000 [Spirochaetaceae bacterium]|nr:MAG: hypothetical protein EHM28_09000 [Spirochaetaceae bacterium]